MNEATAVIKFSILNVYVLNSPVLLHSFTSTSFEVLSYGSFTMDLGVDLDFRNEINFSMNIFSRIPRKRFYNVRKCHKIVRGGLF